MYIYIYIHIYIYIYKLNFTNLWKWPSNQKNFEFSYSRNEYEEYRFGVDQVSLAELTWLIIFKILFLLVDFNMLTFCSLFSNSGWYLIRSFITIIFIKQRNNIIESMLNLPREKTMTKYIKLKIKNSICIRKIMYLGGIENWAQFRCKVTLYYIQAGFSWKGDLPNLPDQRWRFFIAF